MTNKYIVASSMGNDSIALIQFMINGGYDFSVVYNDTGWASEEWPARVSAAAAWLLSKGVTLHITKSEGMINLVKRKKGWPMPASAMQFCTSELKEKPTIELLDKIDSGVELIVVTGRRREERQNRRDLAEWQEESVKHDGRDVWNPLVRLNEKGRDLLLSMTPFGPLPHSSMECSPYVCANKKDMAKLDTNSARINLIELTEIEMGFTKNEKPRTMFRPYRVGGAVGIRQVIEWSNGKHGHKAKFIPNEYKFDGVSVSGEGVSDVAYEIETKQGREFSRQYDGGYCGS